MKKLDLRILRRLPMSIKAQAGYVIVQFRTTNVSTVHSPLLRWTKYTPVLYALRSAGELQAQAQGVIELKILIFHLAPLTFSSVKSSHSHLRQLAFLILGNPFTTRT
jgi:hypothetical protein